MTQVVVFPDAEAVYADALRTGLVARGDTASVVVQLPTTLPARFVHVRRNGGLRDTPVTDTPRLTVRCWGSSDVDAHDLAQLCRALSFALRGDASQPVQVYRVDEVGGPVPVWDDDSERPSYLFTHQLRLRGAVQ